MNTMTNREATLPIQLSATEKSTIRTAAYGAVTLMSFADVAGSPHKTATAGTLALTSATGPVGHVLAVRKRDYKLQTKSSAALADQVLPALTDSVALLKERDAAEAENFRNTVIVAIGAAAGIDRRQPSPPVTSMIRKITAALDAAGQARPELQKLADQIAEAGFTGVQLRVNDEHGEWTGSAGVAVLGESARPSTDGHFRIGSNTKTFTATVVLRLVAEGRIGLDTPVVEYLPEFDLDARVTVRMLLQHTSGIFNFTGEHMEDGTVVPGIVWSGREWVEDRFRTYEPAELVRLALSKPARFEPGADWSYANTNYVLARLVVEKVTGRSLADEMRRLVIGPLGLTGTSMPETRPDVPAPHAHAYYAYEEDGAEKTVDVTRQNPSWISTGGDMISTTKDLHTFIAALTGGKLLPEELRDEMFTPHPKVPYGLGVFVQDTGDGKVVTHNGGISGHAGLMYSTLDGKTLTAGLNYVDDADLSKAAAFQASVKILVDTVFGGEGNGEGE